MKSSKELYDILKPQLEILDRERKEKVSRFAFIYIIFIAIFLFQFEFFNKGILLQYGISFQENWLVYNIPMFILFLIIFGFQASQFKQYTYKFKNEIVLNILRSFSENISLNPEAFIDDTEALRKSNFLRVNAKGVDGEDLVSGEMEGTEFIFSEINAYETIRLRGRDTKIPILKGIFLIADLSVKQIEKVDIRGKIIFKKVPSILLNRIYKNAAPSIVTLLSLFVFFRTDIIFFLLPPFFVSIYFTALIYLYYFAIPKGFRSVKTNNPKLEENYSIYTTTPEKIEKFLSADLIDSLISLQEKTLTSASIHIRDYKAYIFIPHSFDIFEPRIFRTNIDPKTIEETYDLIKCFHDIILSLNPQKNQFHSILLD